MQLVNVTAAAALMALAQFGASQAASPPKSLKAPCFSGCVRPKAELPPPPTTGDPQTVVLKLLQWIGSVHDLADADKLLTGLRQAGSPDPFYEDLDGHQQLDWTRYLDDMPLSDGSPIKISYTVDDPKGSAAKLFGSRVRQLVQIDVNLDVDKVCINQKWVEHHFGPASRIGVVTDGGGLTFTWDIGIWRQRRTEAMVWFGPRADGCARNMFISQTVGAA